MNTVQALLEQYNVRIVPGGGAQVRVAERTAASRLHAGHSLHVDMCETARNLTRECLVQNITF